MIDEQSTAHAAPAWQGLLRAVGIGLLLMSPMTLAEINGAGAFNTFTETSNGYPRSLGWWVMVMFKYAYLPLGALALLACLARCGPTGPAHAVRALLVGGGPEKHRVQAARALGAATRAVILGGVVLAFLCSLGVTLRMNGGFGDPGKLSPSTLAEALIATLLVSVGTPILALLVLAPGANRARRDTNLPDPLGGAWSLALLALLIPSSMAFLSIFTPLPS